MITPNNVFGNGLVNPFFKTKNYTVSCGSCTHAWKVKTSTQQDECIEKCPCCGEINGWSHSLFFEAYNQKLKS